MLSQWFVFGSYDTNVLRTPAKDTGSPENIPSNVETLTSKTSRAWLQPACCTFAKLFAWPNFKCLSCQRLYCLLCCQNCIYHSQRWLCSLNTFAIPVSCEKDMLCHIKKNSDKAKLMREAWVTIWDQVPMQSWMICEIVDRTYSQGFVRQGECTLWMYSCLLGRWLSTDFACGTMWLKGKIIGECLQKSDLWWHWSRQPIICSMVLGCRLWQGYRNASPYDCWFRCLWFDSRDLSQIHINGNQMQWPDHNFLDRAILCHRKAVVETISEPQCGSCSRRHWGTIVS